MPDSESARSRDRRAGDRHLACTVASVERPDGQERPALVHDLSETGALLLVRTAKIHLGDRLVIRLHIAGGDASPQVARATVVRVDAVDSGDLGPWLLRVGVRFTEPVIVAAADIEGFRQRARRLGIRS